MHDQLSSQLQLGERIVPTQDDDSDLQRRAWVEYRVRVLASELGRLDDEDDDEDYAVREISFDSDEASE